MLGLMGNYVESFGLWISDKGHQATCWTTRLKFEWIGQGLGLKAEILGKRDMGFKVDI